MGTSVLLVFVSPEVQLVAGSRGVQVIANCKYMLHGIAGLL